MIWAIILQEYWILFNKCFIMIQFPFFVMKRVYQKNIVADRYG
ncbi:hypothetical protein RO1_29440 [Roseburia intestinalis XB6B4]|uniref:Uncharacterized protein n=1 Tax=Roseburia intestinalis XB6B4 TaxID=718255 RepID=D4L127_9FIRM|nr:hypothetical protein RO1_29440 [Roseburia intestinalis XB6B4]